jgi:hypothetical protein
MQELVQGLPFQGGASSYIAVTSWDHPSLSTPTQLEARFRFSLNTCSGCHTRETLTEFYHIRPRGNGFPPKLSPFLLDNPLVVKDVRDLVHEFSEMDKRKQSLSGLANGVCNFKGGVPFFQKLMPLVSKH